MSFNTSLNTLTERSSSESMYDFQVNDELSSLTSSQLTQLEKMKMLHYKKTANIINFTTANAKSQYNIKYIFLTINVSNIMFFRLHYDYKLLSELNKKLFNQYIELF